MAFRSITWPLAVVTEIGRGYYGTVDVLSRTHTLVGLCRFMLTIEHRDAFDRLLSQRKFMPGSTIRRSLRPNFQAHVPKKMCPLCAQDGWTRFGAMGVMWPHLGPMVEACWRHDCLLVPWTGDTETSILQCSGDPASAQQIRLARDTVRLCRMGYDVAGTCVSLVDQLHGLGQLSASGDSVRNGLADRLTNYIDQHVNDPIYRTQFSPYSASRLLLTFLRSEGNGRIQPLFLVFLLGFIDELSSAGSAAMARCHEERRAQPLWTAYVEPTMPAGPFVRDDAARLLLLGGSYQKVASLTGWKNGGSLRGNISRQGLIAQVAGARKRFLRPIARQRWLELREESRTDRGAQLHRELVRMDAWLNRNDGIWRYAYLKEQRKRRKFEVKLPETDAGLARLAESLRIAVAQLAGRGNTKGLTCEAIARESGIPISRFCRWLATDQRFRETYEAIVAAAEAHVPQRVRRSHR